MVTAERRTLELIDIQSMGLPLTGTPTCPGTIGVVTGELLRYPAFWRSLQSLITPKGTAVAYSAGLDLPTNRNQLVEHMKGDWLFTLDDDAVLLPNTLVRLIDVLDRGEYDVVSAFALQRTPPFPSLVFLEDATQDPRPTLWEPDGRRGVMEIAACGLPACIIHRRVFEKLEKPYFRVGQVDPDHFHEDVEFCHRVKAAGFRIAVDLDTPIGHVTPMAVWPARGPNDEQYAVLAGNGGAMVPTDLAQLRATMKASPQLVGL